MTTRRQPPLVDNAEQTAAEATATVKAGSRTLKQFGKKFYNDWSLHLVQALTYAIVTALIPIAMLLLGIAGPITGTLNKNLQNQLFGPNGQITKALPPPLNTPELHHSALDKLQSASGIFIVLAVIAAIFFGSRLFTLLEECFDIVYRVPQRPTKRKNGIAILMLLVFVVLTPILGLAALIPQEFAAILANTPMSTNTNTMSNLAGIISSLIVSFILFEVMYAFVPNKHGTAEYKLKRSWKGALTAAVALQIFLIVFQLYTRLFMSGIVGQIFFALAIIVFFYLVSLAIMVGVEVNAYFVEGIPPTTNDLITRSARSD